MKVWVTQYLVPSEHREKGFYVRANNTTELRGPDYEYTPDGWVFLCEEEVEVKDPTFDAREVLLKALEGEKKLIMADYAKSMASIEDKIGKLTALVML